jgi:hypothetical protein
MRMRDDEGGETPGALTSEERCHHSPAGVAAFSPGAGIHHHELAAGSPDDGAVTLPYIEKM